MIDIDHFKRINDAFGHQIGDHVLREVAEILRQSLRKTDYAFRYGGDEFVVLMPEADPGRADMLAERMRDGVAGGGESTLPEFRLTLSIGIADCTVLSQAQREELLKRADGALYQAKNSGRDQVCIAISPVERAVGVN